MIPLAVSAKSRLAWQTSHGPAYRFANGMSAVSSKASNVALPPPTMEVAADGAPHDEFPVTLDDAVPSGTRVKLRQLHR
jgi:hypothetical protein